MQYLIEHPEATHFCLLTNMKKLEQIRRNGLKKLNFAGWLYFFVWEQFDRQIVSFGIISSTNFNAQFSLFIKKPIVN